MMAAFRILAQNELVIFSTALAALIFVKKYQVIHRSLWISVFLYFAILHFLFHFEMRYVYLIIPGLAMIGGSFFNFLWTRYTKKIAIGLFVLSIIYPVAVIVKYDILLNRPDTRSLTIEWINNNIGDDEFIISSPSIIIDRTPETLEREQQLGSIRAREAYMLENHDRVAGEIDREFNYTNIHFWNSKQPVALLDYVDQYKPKYFILDYHFSNTLSFMEYSMMASGKLIMEFTQSDLSESYDINGNFSASNDILFKLERIQIYQLNQDT